MLDHGILNVPLAKRGNINAQLDRYKAQQAAEAKQTAKAKAATNKEKVAQAKARIASMTDETATRLMARFSMTRKQLEKKLNSIAHFTPDQILALKDL